MTTAAIPMDCILDRLTAEDNPAAWKKVLSVLGEEFVERYRAQKGKQESWFLGLARVRIGGARTKVDGRQQVDSLCRWATRMHLAGRTACQSLLGQ